MNKKLMPEQALECLAAKFTTLNRSQGNKVACGVWSDRQCRLRCFPTGLTVAMSLERPLSQAASACLLLAVIPEACDDALYIEQGQLWLLRRYARELTEAELDLLFKQQLVLAALFAPRKRALPPRSTAEKYA